MITKKIICIISGNIENLKSLKHHTSSKKHYFCLIFSGSAGMKIKKIFKEKGTTEILKILCLIENIKWL